MSVWKKIESEVLAKDVKRDLFERALNEDLGVTLDYKTNNIRNTWGSETVDCAIVNNGRVTALGFRFSDNGGVELVGDIFGSGLGGDGKQESLMNKIAQFYQKHNLKQNLELNGWIVEDIKINDKKEIEINAYQW